MKNKLIVLSGFVLALMLVLTPSIGFAQVTTVGSNNSFGNVACNSGQVQDISGVLCKIGQLLNSVVPVLIALGVVYFIWGVISYVIGSDEEAKKAGRDRIIFGIIGLAVIVAVWGLVRILTRTFNVDNTGTITLPTI